MNVAADADQILASLYKSLALLQNYTIFTLGQNSVFPGAEICIDPAASNTTMVACKAPTLLPKALAN